MPWKSNDESIPKCSVFLSTHSLFQLLDEAIRVTSVLVGVLVKDAKSEECCAKKKGIDQFKDERMLNNDNLEASLIRLASDSHSRHCFATLENCTESPSKIWNKCLKSNDNSIGPPKIAGRRINGLNAQLRS